MDTIFDCYTLKIDLPFYNNGTLTKGMRFYEDMKDHKFKSLCGVQLPSWVNILDKSTFEHTQHKCLYKIGDHIQFKLNKHPQTGEIIDLNNPFTASVKIDGSYSSDGFPVKFSDIVKTVYKYFYITSAGQIQSAIEGKDFLADDFRKRIGNYFSSKHEAHQYKQKMLDDARKKTYEQQ